MTLGEKLAQLRSEHDLTQKELALKLNTSTGTIAEWESDETAPTPEDVLRICEVFDISPNCLRDDPTETAAEEEIALNPETIENSFEAPEETRLEQEIRPAAETEDTPKRSSKSKKTVLFIALAAVLLACAALLLVFFVFNKPFSKDSKAIAKADSSVVMVYCYDFDGNLSATGSGFIAYNDKTVITNYHVIEEGYTCKISTSLDVQYEVKSIIRCSEEMDIAILSLKERTDLTPLDFGDSNAINKGDNVVAIGSPLGIKNTVSTGVISARVKEGANEILQFTAAISPGSSGGALFNDKGEVIGITYASYVDGQNLNLAIPIEKVDELYNQDMTVQRVFEPYVKKYPYIEYLQRNSIRIINTTFEEIKRNPGEYDGKLVRFDAYLSSYRQIVNKYTGGKYLGLYLSNEKHTSTYDNDEYTYFYLFPSLYGDNPTNYPLLQATVSAPETDIPFGDHVVCIGEANYYDMGGLGWYYLAFHCDVIYSLDSCSYVIGD